MSLVEINTKSFHQYDSRDRDGIPGPQEIQNVLSSTFGYR